MKARTRLRVLPRLSPFGASANGAKSGTLTPIVQVSVVRSNHCKVLLLVTVAGQSNGAADCGARPYS